MSPSRRTPPRRGGSTTGATSAKGAKGGTGGTASTGAKGAKGGTGATSGTRRTARVQPRAGAARPGVDRRQLQDLLAQIDAAGGTEQGGEGGATRAARPAGAKKVTGRGAAATRKAAELARLRAAVARALATDLDGADEDDDASGAGSWDEDDGADEDEGADDVWDGDDDDGDDEDEDDEDGDWGGGGGSWGGWPRRRGWAAPAKPIPVDGGLALRSRRGPVAGAWWSVRFLSGVESVMVGGRLDRGRTYARKGQVVDLTVGPGMIEARVQGTRKSPYRVRLAMPVVPDADWDAVVVALGAQAGFAARLLAGDLPHEVEELFAAEGASLFPAPHARLTTDCSCPDWANPCKHVAAVCYVVAEAFDRDPFAVLTWRGRDRQRLLADLRHLRAAGTSAAPEISAADEAVPGSLAAAGAIAGGARPAAGGAVAPPLAECLLGFWKAGPELAEVRVRPEASPLPGGVLRHLAPGLLEVRGHDVGELLAPAYGELTAAAARRALRDDPASPAPGRG